MINPNLKNLRGVFPVLQTPLDDMGRIDRGILEREIDWVFETGADGIVVAMVSEVLRLGYRGRRELAEHVCGMAGNRGSIIISVGAESIHEAIEFAEHAESRGSHAVMAIPPVSTRLDSNGTTKYFAEIARSVSIPLVVQDASSYVGAAIDLSVYLRLLDEFGDQRIYFKPEASPLGPNVSKLRDATAGKARIFEGSGGINLVDCYRRGVVGTMPAADLLDGIVALWDALQKGDDHRIYRLSLPIAAIASLQLQAGLDGFLAIEKHLLQKRGIFTNTHRVQPCAWQLDRETGEEVDRLFAILQQAIKS